jgi:type VI secretion system protein ImpL
MQIDQVRLGWLTEAARGAPPIRASTLFYGPGAPYVTGRVEVAGVYTKLGWEKVRALLESEDAPLDLEPWVLGKSDKPVPRAELAEQLKSVYFKRYGSAWLDFLRGLEVQTAPPDIGGARAELSALAENDGPYRQLFRALSDNLRLDVAPTTVVGKLVEKGAELLDGGAATRPISSVERRFQPLLQFGSNEGKADAPAPLDQYLVHLSTLEAALKELTELADKPSTDLSSEFSRKVTAVEHLLSGMDVTLRGPLEPLLMAPIRGASAQPTRQALSGISEAWKTEVWETYNSKIRPRFPFAESADEVSVPEFADFFRPETGAIAKFFKQNLEPFLQRSGNAFVPRDAANALPFRSDFLHCLGVAQEITDAVFGTGAEPAVPFSVRIHPAGANIAEVALVVDGQATVYRNEPERWVLTQWPGKGDPRGAALQVRGDDFTDEIPRMGDFGLFRLLAAGGIKPTGRLADGVPTLAAGFTMTRAGEAPVNVEFKPSKTPNPFKRDFFTRLTCPAETTSGLPAGPARSAP